MREIGIRENIGGKMEWVSLSDHAFLRQRRIYLTGEVNEETARQVLLQLQYLSEKERGRRITLFINSPGGEVDEGLLIYDAMQDCGCPVRTIATGRACSMGGFLLAAGSKGERFATPHAKIMLHQPSSGTYGKVSDMETSLEEMIRTKDTLNELLSVHTGKTKEEVKNETERDLWLTPAEAKAFGLIDGIWTGEGDRHE